jgi:alkylation response protein AidB-like acyl-CoA dehydrogenase
MRSGGQPKVQFNLSEEQLTIKQLAKEITDEEILPVAGKYDEEERFPLEIMLKLEECGIVNLSIPEIYGGPGVDRISHALIVEEIARGCAAVATTLEANSLASYPILVGGTEELKKEYLSRLTEEGKFASFALTEPQAGSDVASLSTTIERVGDEYILNGEKCFITNASYADYFVVLATQSGLDSRKRFTALVVERDSNGISIGAKEKKMGLRASDTASLSSKKCEFLSAIESGMKGKDLRFL